MMLELQNTDNHVYWSYTDSEFYTDGIKYINNYTVDIDELSKIINEGDFQEITSYLSP